MPDRYCVLSFHNCSNSSITVSTVQRLLSVYPHSLFCVYGTCTVYSSAQSLTNFARPFKGQRHEMPRPRNRSWINMYKEISIYIYWYLPSFHSVVGYLEIVGSGAVWARLSVTYDVADGF
jgi:hypothetical protein